MAKLTTEYYNDDVYRNLDDVSTNGHNEDPMFAFDFAVNSHSSHSHSSTISRRTREEDIYEDLCYVTLRLGRERDKVLRVLPLEPVEKRDYCIEELVETEKNYCDALNMIVNHFITPLSKFLRSEDRRVLFLHIKSLHDIHTRFYNDLYKACSKACHNSHNSHISHNSHNSHNSYLTTVGHHHQRISQCFISWKDKFVIYGEYCANLSKAQELIDEICAKEEQFNQELIKNQMRANEGKFKLRDLLSLPMQRILKYHLLLSELIKNTSETHEDYAGLQKAHLCMVDIGQYINEVKRDSETLEIITDIQASITDLDMPENTKLKDYGRLLKDGDLKIRSHEDSRLKNRYIFIFDKVMLMCKSIRGEQYSYKEALILADYQVEDMPTQSTISKLTKQWSNGWYLVHRQNKTTFAFYAKSEEIKRKWIEAIEKALDNVCPLACREGSTDHTFAMFTFSAATVCAECDKLLRGTFFQGYQCTVCNIAVHKQCIATVRSCGAPSLPTRPSLPSSSPVASINSFSGDEDNIRNSATDLRRLNSMNNDQTLINSKSVQSRALNLFEGDSTATQLSYNTDDIILGANKKADNLIDHWDSRNNRNSEEVVRPSSIGEEIETPNDENQTEDDDPNAIFGVYQSHQNDEKSRISLEEYPWFAGSMDREMARLTLERSPNGSFLVRISSKQRNSYAISLNYNGQVKHMRVCITPNHRYYYLSESRFFKTIVDLVEWYEANSLCESFNLVNINLLIPYKIAINNGMDPAVMSPLTPYASTMSLAPIPFIPIAYAIAVYGFAGSSPNLLTLRKGDRVAVLSKAGEGKGWWKGQIDERIGYFPLAYVTEIKDLCESKPQPQSQSQLII